MYVSGPSLDLVYDQTSGCMYVADNEDARALLCRGYSGYGVHRNEPKSEALRSLGPIPRGMWTVVFKGHHPRLGPCVFALKPVGHKAHGRTEFFIHGDNSRADGTASTGCIIAPRPAREAIRALGVRALLVF